MYKMIIADDEPAVRQYLRYIVKQYHLPFHICGEAEDGEQAVRLTELHKPEFVILDINMPFLNGLDAAKQIREKYRDTVIYILTAYSHFDYAHQAVQTQVAGYLLKPIKPAELAETLKKGIANVLSQRIASQRLQRMERQIAKDRPVVTKQKLFELLKNDKDNPTALNLLQSIAKQENFYPAAIISASYWPIAATPVIDGLEERLTWECAGRFGDYAIVAAFSQELVIIFGRWGNELRCELQAQLEEWEHLYNITFCAGISLVASPARIGRDYRNAAKKREVGLFWQQQGLLVSDSSIAGRTDIECAAVQKQIQDCLLERRADQAKVILRQFLGESMHNVCQPEYIYAAIIKIANTMIAKYAEYLISTEEAGRYRQIFISQLNKTASAGELEQCLYDLIDKLESNTCTCEQNQAEQSVKWAIEYINNNYHKDLTLEQFAEKLFMSTGYFCRSFKKYAGEGYAAYLTKIRLKKARERLMSGKYTVAEVARMVGFRDASYFSSVFKKHYQQSPSNLAAATRQSC
ncbi:response regulator [Sporomusa termitida]|uniref:HTH-type transcriptional activator RhaS n=1 Tax=Sporomusa termitida TaxID=2377 RepID=A0A517DP16_9FIRM|nr:response regulator [Sporomusa termitida]QDR79037.1 HTH-type transcriptional activator RhaS [Sporomusa termitida]